MKAWMTLAAALAVATPCAAQTQRPDRFEMRVGTAAATLQAVTAEIGLLERARRIAALCSLRPEEWRRDVSRRQRERLPRLAQELTQAYPRLNEALAREVVLGMISMATRAAIEETTVYGRTAACEAARRHRDIEHAEALLQIRQPPAGAAAPPVKTP